MSEWLIASVPPDKALRLLSRIDDECANAPVARDFHFYHGPFGAFKTKHESSSPTHEPFDQHKDSSVPSAPPGTDETIPETPQIVFSPWTQELMQSTFDAPDYDLSFTDFMDMPTRSGHTEEVFGRITMPDLDEPLITPFVQRYFSSSQIVTTIHTTSRSSPPCLSSISTSGANNDVPQDAVLLLKHYATVVISSLTPFHHSKTPWHILFLPLAKNCLAALTLGEHIDHAVLCAFYGTLAISAFSLGVINQAQIWLERSETYKNIAREHSKLALRTAYCVPKAAKYKSILIALLTMAQVTTFSGSFRDTEYFLLEAEKFIRLKGLN